MKKIVLAGMMLTAALLAQTKTKTNTESATERYFTQGGLNCRWFTGAADDSQQIAYVMGVREAVAMVGSDTYTEPGSTNGEVQNGMKTICSAPENALIRAVDAYSLFVAKIRGVSDAALKDLTSNARIYARYGVWPEVDKPKPEPTKGKL